MSVLFAPTPYCVTVNLACRPRHCEGERPALRLWGRSEASGRLDGAVLGLAEHGSRRQGRERAQGSAPPPTLEWEFHSGAPR